MATKKNLEQIPPVVVLPGLPSGLLRTGLILALLLALAACSKRSESRSDGPFPRVVSLTPSASQLVLALGAGEHLVGVDRFSADDARLAALPVVGDFLSPSFEAMARLEPDLVICDAVQDKVRLGLREAGIKTVVLEMHELSHVTRGLRDLGRALGKEDVAAARAAALEDAVAEARSRAAQRARRPRLLVIIDRDPTGLGGLVGAGPGSYVGELLDIVGATNVLETSAVRYPRISSEEVLRGAPDVIVDASPAAGDLSAWSQLPLPNTRVVADTDYALTAPSPDVERVLARLESIAYPP